MMTFAVGENERMNDLISRQAAIDAALTYLVEYCGAAFDEDMQRMLKERLDSLPSAQQWIPCSEKLPYAEYGESDTVLTTCGYRDVEDTSVRWIRLLYFNGGNWCYPTGETYEAKVYAWCPLPEPWKGEPND